MVAMVVIPLNDSTEARYAEIARKMLETGNWIVLQHDYGVPFWAKPPLSTWLSAISMKLFGIHAFAARLPSLILSIACVWMVGSVALQSMNRTSSQFAMLVLMGSIYFLLDAGAVMTDPALLFSITLMMVAFWKVIVATNTPPQYLLFWRYALFVGAGLGLLAKGPIAVIFSGASIFIWVALHHEWRKVWQNLPWGKGIGTTFFSFLLFQPLGLSIHYINKEFDMGNIICRFKFKENRNDTTRTLYSKLLKKLEKFFIENSKKILENELITLSQKKQIFKPQYYSREEFEKIIRYLPNGYDTKVLDLIVHGLIIRENLKFINFLNSWK